MTAQVIRIGIDARTARTGGEAVRGELRGIKREARGLQGQLVTTGRSLVNARNLLMSFATAAGISQAVKLADTYKLINARLMNVSGSAQEASRAYSRLLAMSNRTRSAIEGSAALYTKLIMSGKQYGVTQERALVITENVNKALRISGASAIEAAAAQLQLSQAIASGTLQGDEFRSVMENAPRLARALVESLQLKGGVGELRKLSREGKLTIDQLVKALTDANISDKLEKEFKNIPLTVGQAMEVLKNQTMDAIGNFDKLNYVTAGLSKAIVFLASNLGTLVQMGFPLLVSWLLRSSGATAALSRALLFLGTMATGTGARMATLGRFARIYGTGAMVAAASTRALGAATRVLGSILTNLNLVLTALITVLVMMATHQDIAAKAADRMAEREGRLGGVVDMLTGKINTQNAVLLTNIRLKAQAAMRDAQSGLSRAQRSGLEAAGQRSQPFSAALPGGPLLNKVLGSRNGMAGTAMGKELETYFKTGKALGGSEGLINRMQQLVDKGKMSQKTFEQATKAIGTFLMNVNDLNQANAELRILSGKGSEEDKKLLGIGATQPPITSPNLGKKTKEAKSKADELNARLEKAQANANKLADIMGKWDEQPKLIDQANKDKRALDEMVGEWVEINGQVVKYTQAMAELGKDKIDTGLTRQLKEDLAAGKDALLVQALQVQGQNVLAEAVRRVLDYKRQGIPVDEQAYQQILNQVAAEEQLAKAMEKKQRQLDIFRAALGDIQMAFEDLLMKFKPGDFIKSVGRSLKQLQVRLISEKLFGPLYQQLEDMVMGRSGIKAANDFLAQQAKSSGNSLGTFNDSIINTANILAQVNQRLQAIANGDVPEPYSGTPTTTDANGDIIVTGSRIPRGGTGGDIGPSQLIELLFGGIARPIISVLEKLGVKLPKNFSKEFGAIIGDAVFGAQVGPAIAQSLGFLKNGGGIAGQVGGAIGSVLGKLGGAAVGKALGGVFGSIGGPIGSMLGGVLGSALIGGLFGPKPKFASVTVSGSGGAINVGAPQGRGSQQKGVAAGLGDSVSGGISRIADALGGSLGNFSVSIGVDKNGDYVVDVLGLGRLKSGDNNTPEFKSQEEAIRFAILDAIKDGAIEGISEGAKRLLKQAKDLESAIDKAMKFEGVFKDLKRLTDPVDYAVDELNTKFKQLKGIFKEAGASSEEWGKLEELYNLERKKLLEEQVKELQDFLKDLTGDKSFKTAYDRLQEADLAFRKFEEDIAAGKQVDQGAFTEAGQRLQDLAREVYGSTADFFDYQNRLIAATQGAIDIVEAVADSQDNILVIRDAITTGNGAIIDGLGESNGWLRAIFGAMSGGNFTQFGSGRY